MEKENREGIVFIYIWYVLNEGEYKVLNLNFKLDGYCLEMNIVYEFNGCLWYGCFICYIDKC